MVGPSAAGAATERQAMGDVPRAFIKQGAVEVEAVAAALQPEFALAAGPEKTVVAHLAGYL